MIRKHLGASRAVIAFQGGEIENGGLYGALEASSSIAREWLIDGALDDGG